MVNDPHITIGEPERFTPFYKCWQMWPQFVFVVFLILTCGLLLSVFDVLRPSIRENFEPMAFLLIGLLYYGFVLVIILASGVLYIAFLPLIAGNLKIVSWNRETRDKCRMERAPCFVVELALTPRVVEGVEGWLDDADDVGVVSLRPDHLRYQGDAIDMTIPWSQIASVRATRTGHRMMWASGKDVHLAFQSVVDGRESLRFRVREGVTIVRLRRRNAELAERLEWFWRQSGAPGDTPQQT